MMDCFVCILDSVLLCDPVIAPLAKKSYLLLAALAEEAKCLHAILILKYDGLPCDPVLAPLIKKLNLSSLRSRYSFLIALILLK
jgi:hypothetical protein